MSGPGAYAAELLRRGAGAYAVRAVEALLDASPDASHPYGDRAFWRWKDNHVQRVHELAAADWCANG